MQERTTGGPFKSLGDLLQRVRLPARERRALVLCGACDGLGPLRAEDYPFVHEEVLESLKAGAGPADLQALQPPRARPASQRLSLHQALTRIQNELSLLGMHLSAHPLALLRPEADRYSCIPVSRAATLADGAPLRLLVIAAAMRRVRSATGILQFLTLEDESGLLEAVVLPAVYAALGNRVITPGPFLADGRLRRRQGAAHAEISALNPFHQRPRPYGDD